MLNIKYKYSPENISWAQVVELFGLVGWGTRVETEIKAAFEQSTYCCFALDGDNLVGFGRTVDDGQYYALIVDLVIHPDYQKQGIGSQLLELLKKELSSYLFVTLSAAPGKHGFYLKQEWKKQSSAFIWPRNSQQEKEHCEE
ncbi:MAG: GNAT family N-acetyltransferase [Aureispira sp.]|nr:GNAT family N-acetyltransferase [Aureispira sp.]